MTHADLSPRVGRAFYGHLSSLREAQLGAMAPLLAGEDVLVVAGTGSGKTEAVLVPLVDRHLAERSDDTGPVIVYVAPTKALVNDLVGRLERPLAALGLRAGARHGERDDLSTNAKPHVLITTLESYDSVLTAHPGLFAHVQAVVVDEVHQLAGTQRGLQLQHVIARHEHLLGRRLQVAAMSATVDHPAVVWERLRPHSACQVVAAKEDRTRSYVVVRTESDGRLAEVLDKTRSAGKVLCFAGSRRNSEQIAALMRGRAFGERVLVHHSSLAAASRLLVEEEFRRPDPAIAVATSTLELGIDIGDVELVVLIGPPTDWRSFSQRIGRAGRRGNSVRVLCLIPPWSKTPVRDHAAFLALIGQLEDETRPGASSGFLVGATGQQLVNQLRQTSADSWQTVDELGGAVGCHDSELVGQLLEALSDEDLVRRHPVRQSLWAGGPGIGELAGAGDLWGNFPVGSTTIALLHQGRHLGDVSGANRKQLVPGASFVFQGRAWRVISRSRNQVSVQPHDGRPSFQLRFGAKGVPLDTSVVAALPRAIASPVRPGVRQDPETAAWWASVRENLGPTASDAHLRSWRDVQGQWVTATSAGRVLNAAALVLLGLEGSADDTTVRTSVEPDLTALPADLSSWTGAIARVVEVPGELTTWQGRLPTQLLVRELVEAVTSAEITTDLIQRMRSWPVVEVPDDRWQAICPE